GPGRDALRGGVLPDAAHVLLGNVADDGQVPAPLAGARPGRGLRYVGRGSPALRLAHGRLLSTGPLAHPRLRGRRVAGYLASAPGGTPLFLWVHFFEPHEPYVLHPEHAFTGAPTA